VTDALRHVPDVLTYLARLRNQSIFNFCAIPQVGRREVAEAAI
jgi:farnesyl-diphosphate farnesyltransferase